MSADVVGTLLVTAFAVAGVVAVTVWTERHR